jgi:hypothetical protein
MGRQLLYQPQVERMEWRERSYGSGSLEPDPTASIVRRRAEPAVRSAMKKPS